MPANRYYQQATENEPSIHQAKHKKKLVKKNPNPYELFLCFCIPVHLSSPLGKLDAKNKMAVTNCNQN